MPTRCWRRSPAVRGLGSVWGDTDEGRHILIAVARRPFADRTRSAADRCHRPPLDARRRVASGRRAVVSLRSGARPEGPPTSTNTCFTIIEIAVNVATKQGAHLAANLRSD